MRSFFDVGGLFIKTAVLNAHGQVVPNTYAIYPARSKESKEEILDHFMDLNKHQDRISARRYRYRQNKPAGPFGRRDLPPPGRRGGSDTGYCWPIRARHWENAAVSAWRCRESWIRNERDYCPLKTNTMTHRI